MDDEWTVVQDPMFYKGLLQRWKYEVLFQVAKVTRLKERLEAVRDVLRELEQADWQDVDKRKQLHRLVFN